jgi:hypothetical protein
MHYSLFAKAKREWPNEAKTGPKDSCGGESTMRVALTSMLGVYLLTPTALRWPTLSFASKKEGKKLNLMTLTHGAYRNGI